MFKFLIVQSPNTFSLTLHVETILVDPNLLAYHFFFNKKTIIHLNLEIYNVLSQKFHVLSCYDEHGIIVLYDENMSLTKNMTITYSSVEFITTFLITHEKTYI